MNADSHTTTKLWPWLTELAAQGPVRVQIRGGCMTPAIHDGDAVDVKRSRIYWPGDVLAARTKDGRLVAHRFLGCVPTRKGLAYVTQADDAVVADGLMFGEDILGRVLMEKPKTRERVRAAGRFVRVLMRASENRAKRWVTP